MNIRKYEAYVRAVELGSLSKAAEQLGYTQSRYESYDAVPGRGGGISPDGSHLHWNPAQQRGGAAAAILGQLLNTNESGTAYCKIKGADTGGSALPLIPVWQPIGSRRSSGIFKKTIQMWKFRSPKWGPAPSRKLWPTARRSFASTQAGKGRTSNGCLCAGTGCWCWYRQTIR